MPIPAAISSASETTAPGVGQQAEPSRGQDMSRAAGLSRLGSNYRQLRRKVMVVRVFVAGGSGVLGGGWCRSWWRVVTR
jgi:hypothetical protein